MSRVATPVYERFVAKYIPEPNTGCWLWLGAVNNKGYGLIGLGSRKQGLVYAHRLSWEYHHNRKVPTNLEICHRCDNPCCVNPDHLFVGTHQENMLDAKKKGRIAKGLKSGAYTKPQCRCKGEMHGNHRLTSEVVLAIRTMVTKGYSYTELANKYHVSAKTVADAVQHKTWRHL